jgi:hypothetical protein
VPKIKNTSPNIIEGIPNIAEYMGKHRNTIMNWINKGYLPAAKNPDGIWFITKSLINMWIFSQNQAELRKRVAEGDSRIDPEVARELLMDGKDKTWG